jgi:hypothetical protein
MQKCLQMKDHHYIREMEAIQGPLTPSHFYRVIASTYNRNSKFAFDISKIETQSTRSTAVESTQVDMVQFGWNHKSTVCQAITKSQAGWRHCKTHGYIVRPSWQGKDYDVESQMVAPGSNHQCIVCRTITRSNAV